MKAQNGFTLIELLVVLMVGAIMLMWALPSIDIAEMRIRSAEQQVATTVLGAQQRAVMKQHDVRVVFDTAARHIVVHDDQDNDGVQDAAEPVRMLELPEGVQFTGEGTPGTVPAAVTFTAGSEGLPALTFHRGGFGSENGSVYLGTERSARGEQPGDARQLEVERATGRVTRHHVAGGIWQTHRT